MEEKISQGENLSQPLDIPLLFRAMEERMEERMNVIMKQLARTNDRYDEFRDAAENQMAEFMLRLSGGEDIKFTSTRSDMESKQPEDPDLSVVYEENEEEVNVSFRVNEEIVNASRLMAPNVVSRNNSKSVSIKSPGNAEDSKKTGKRIERRESSYRKLDLLNSGVNDRIQVYKNTPSFEYLKLNKFDVGAVMSFAVGIDQFQSKHHLSVPAATLVSEDIKHKLLGICEIPRLNATNFYALDNKPLIQLLQKALRPTNVHDFRRQLDKNLSFSLPKDYKPTVTNFFILHQQLLSYRVEFEQLYDFLADGNISTNIPKCDNKEGGLIKLFVERIPHGIGKRMFISLNTEWYTDIDGFMKAFFEQLRSFYKIAVEARQLNNVLYESSNSPTHSERLSTRTANISDPDKLLLLEQLLENLESEEPASQLAFINSSKGLKPPGVTDSRAPLACFQMAIDGKCNREKCTYSHDRPVLESYLQKLMTKIVKSPYHSKPRVLPSSNSGHSKGYQKHNSLVEESKDKASLEATRHVVNLNYSDTSIAEIVRNEFLHSYPEVGSASPMHREGVLLLANSRVHLTKVMFDSGALHASYIDPKVVARYRKVLKSKITPIRGSVTLGDSKTTHQVSEAVEVDLEFKDDNGKLHTGRVNLVVFESGSHIIIGLPDIARVFGDLFLCMVRNAMDNPLLFTDRHTPSVRVIMGPSLHSLRHHVQESQEELVNPSEVYDSQDTMSVWSESRSEFDPVDSDLWTEVWGPDYESDDTKIKSDLEPVESGTGSNLSLQQQARVFNMIEVCQQIPQVAYDAEELPDLIYDSDDDDSEDGSRDEDSDNDCFPINDTDSVDYVGSSDSGDENDPSIFHSAACDLEPEEEVLEPWTNLLPIAEEDELTELPCSFPDFLAFTELGYEAAVQVYLGLLESHVCEEFQKNSDIMHLLKTKGVKALCPRIGKGFESSLYTSTSLR